MEVEPDSKVAKSELEFIVSLRSEREGHSPDSEKANSNIRKLADVFRKPGLSEEQRKAKFMKVREELRSSPVQKDKS